MDSCMFWIIWCANWLAVCSEMVPCYDSAVTGDQDELPNEEEEELLSEATPPTLEEILNQLGLSQFLELFLKEHIDLDSLVRWL